MPLLSGPNAIPSRAKKSVSRQADQLLVARTVLAADRRGTMPLSPELRVRAAPLLPK